MTNYASLFARSNAFLEKHEQEYPHRCRTSVKYPSPVEVHKKLPDVHFIRAPFVKEAEWGFKTKIGMKAFKAFYKTLDD